MKALLQRVHSVKLEVEGSLFSSINKGILVFLGVEKKDSYSDINYIADKIVNLRIFEDENQKMNLSLKDIEGELMVVSQFTLAGDTKKGRRPGFDNAMPPDEAEKIYCEFVNYISKNHNMKVKTGAFGKHMNINLINDGPVTFIIEK